MNDHSIKRDSFLAVQTLNKVITPFLILYILLLASLVGCGILLNFTNSLGNQLFWRIFWLILMLVFLWKSLTLKRNIKILKVLLFHLKKTLFRANFGEKTLVLVTLATVIFNLFCSLTLYPFNWDSMTYHLARVMYFIQHQNTNFFDATYWPQVIHPIYSSYLNIAFLMLFNDERGMNLIQYISGLFAALSIIGISLLISKRIGASFLSGCIFLNLTIVNLQMTTTQVDLLMAGLLGCSVYFLIKWIQERKLDFAFYGSLSLAIVLGIKGSGFLYIPPLLTVLVTFLLSSHSLRKIYHLFLVFGFAVFVFFTSGYYQNLTLFGNAAGPEVVFREHSFKGIPLGKVLELGLENIVRYSSKLWLSLDGLPQTEIFSELNIKLQELFIYPFQRIGINVYSEDAVRLPFVITPPLFHEDLSYWGILGILIFLSIFLSFFIKSFRAFLPLSLGALVFVLTQSYAGKYDPWRGRFFIACAIFAVPSCTAFWTIEITKRKHQVLSIALSVLLIVASFSSITTLVQRKQTPVATENGQITVKSVFSLKRIQQLTVNRGSLTDPLNKINWWTSQHPSFKLYTILPEDFFEYPLFRGNEVIPLNGFVSGFQTSKVDSIKNGLLLYDMKIYKQPKAGDVIFGEDLFGRVIRN